MKSVVEKLAENSVLFKDKTAIIFRDEAITYGELYARVRGFCGYMKRLGIRRGDLVVCRASATPAYWTAYFGVQLAGGIFVPLEKDVSAETMNAVCASLGKVSAFVAAERDRETAERFGAAFIRTDDVMRVACGNDASAPVGAYPGADDVGQILFTTGTTGTAKGVTLSHRYFSYPACRATDIPYGQDTVMILPTPTNHLLSVGRCTMLLQRGGTAVFTDGLADLGEFYDALADRGANAMTLTPSALNYLIALMGDELSEFGSRISFIEIGGEKLPAARQKEFMKILPGVRFFNMYASTETGEICCYEFSRYGASDERIGKPVQGVTVFFSDENGVEIPADKNDPAFIAVRSECGMSGYWNAGEATRKVMRGGAVIMSDYGYRDNEGFICFAGRAGDVIISGGHKINPAEVENAALATGLVEDCVCFGVPDEVFGKLAALFVVPAKGTAFDRAAVKNGIAARLEGFKVPQIIERTDAVRRNANGKTDRRFYSDNIDKSKEIPV